MLCCGWKIICMRGLVLLEVVSLGRRKIVMGRGGI